MANAFLLYSIWTEHLLVGAFALLTGRTSSAPPQDPSWEILQCRAIYRRLVHIESHPLGGVAGFTVTGGSEDVLSHGRGEVGGRGSYLQGLGGGRGGVHVEKTAPQICSDLRRLSLPPFCTSKPPFFMRRQDLR